MVGFIWGQYEIRSHCLSVEMECNLHLMRLLISTTALVAQSSSMGLATVIPAAQWPPC